MSTKIKTNRAKSAVSPDAEIDFNMKLPGPTFPKGMPEDMIPVNTVYSTTAYHLFHPAAGQRDHDEKEMNRTTRKLMLEELEAHGWDPCMPAACKIVKDNVGWFSRFDVFDGMGRIKGAEQLGIPVLFCIGKPPSTAKANIVHTPMTVDDWIAVQINKPKPNAHFLEIKQWAEETDMQLRLCANLLSGRPALSCGSTAAKLRNGTLEVTTAGRKRMRAIYKMVTAIEEAVEEAKLPFMKKRKKFASLRMSVAALDRFLNLPDFDPNQMIRKIRGQGVSQVRSCGSIDDYMDVYETVYNWRQSPAKRVSLAAESLKLQPLSKQ